ncbi:ATP-dependent endonuclease [Rhodoferax sp. U11-2br]|uniref:ATP-dependent nuclease n=1 Tax=Rhodoferax sp. U11-2br TaxID=2838878 RepID=UPI001BEA405D|nr:AAA family ATPase [Rhodoferax sp. U11-2br]MBT3068135.1 AAA family ATPase [Rhodoferax sp. U11-2br]
MPLENIRVKNFRSLRDVPFDAKDLTVFVGCNDEGKSNLLRALDLFFNGDRRDGYVLNWQRDFCAFTKTPKNKAPQIEITLTFKLPGTFNLGESVLWKRVWRQEGIYKDEIRLVSGKELPSRSKAYSFLKAIRYDYVPAIKGPEYFERILSAVYDMLDATVRNDIRTAAAGFTTEIQRHTKGILADLEAQLGLKSEIELPTDLRQLFSELEFRSEVGGHRVGLSQRGDGVKVRHIPVILRWLADQANHLSAPGKPRVVTIWGYEEPENNLETRKCFELAEFFIANSSSVQTFLTTHSPVFYSVFTGGRDDVNVLEVQLDPVTGTALTARAIGVPSDIDALHSSIGFLDLLEPHVRDWKRRVDQLENRLEEGLDLTHPTIFVEGPTDKIILRATLRRFFPTCGDVRILCATNNGGGHPWVKDSLIAWHHRRGPQKAVGLFDGDAAAQESLDEFVEIVESRTKSVHRALQLRLKPAGVSLDIVKARLNVPVAIEEVCPRECWVKAKSEGWLEARPNLNTLYKFEETEVTFRNWMKDRLPDDELRTIATMRVATYYKEKFAKHVVGRINDSNCQFDFEPLRALLESLLKKIDLYELA